MAPKRAAKRKATKKVAKRRGPSILKAPRGVYGFPDIYRTQLKYTEYRAISLAAGNAYNSTYTYRANSLFDPNFTGAGNQPLYYDQLSQIYRRYRVTGVSLDLTVVNLNSGNPVSLCIDANSSSTTPFSALVTSMQGTDASRLMQITSEGGDNILRYRRFYSIAELQGVKPSAIFNENNFSADITASPTSIGYIHFLFESLNSTTSTVELIPTFTYHCEFYQPIDVNVS